MLLRTPRSFLSHLLATASVIALLSACAVGPDYQRPDLPPVKGYDAAGNPQKIKATDGVGGDAQDFVVGGDISSTWWVVFHSEDLNKVVGAALASNPSLEAAEARLREAEENSAAAFGSLFPSVAAGFGSTREKTTGASAGGKFPGSIFTLHNGTANVSYGLDVFGGTRRVIEEDDARTEYQNFQLEAARLTISSNVVANVVQEASLRAQIEATQSIIKNYEQSVEISRKQLALGAVPETTVLTQVAALEQTRATLPALDKQLAQSRHALSALLGQTPDQEPPGVFDFNHLKLPVALPVSVPVKLVEQRPDIRAAEANLHAASAAIGVAIANRLPGVSLTGSIGTQANALDGLFAPGGGIWSLGASVAQSVFDGGTLAHKQGAAEEEFTAAKADYRSVVLASFQDVADVLRAVQSDAAALKAQDAAFHAAENALKLTQQQYDAGAVSYLTLLDAQRTCDQAKLARVQAMARRYSDAAALFQAMGGGWWNRQSVTTAVTAPQSSVTQSSAQAE